MLASNLCLGPYSGQSVDQPHVSPTSNCFDKKKEKFEKLLDLFFIHLNQLSPPLENASTLSNVLSGKIARIDCNKKGDFENKLFKKKVYRSAAINYLEALMKEIESEEDAKIRAGLMHQFIHLNNCFRTFTFRTRAQFKKFMENLDDELKSMVKFIGFYSTQYDFDQDPEKVSLECFDFIDQLMGFSHLEEVEFSGHLLNDEHLAKLKELKSLTHFQLYWCKGVSVRGIEHLSTLPQLTHLSLRHMTHLKDDDVKPLVNLKRLKWLDLTDCESLTSVSLEETVSKLKHLTYLKLSGTRFSNGLMYLQEMKKLTHLDLSYIENLKDEHLRNIATMTQLTHLDLGYNNKLTEEGISHLSGLVNLTHLKIRYLQNISSTCLRQLTPLVNLTHLCLYYLKNVKDIDFKHISNFTNLIYLNIRIQSGISNDTLEYISRLPHLLHLKMPCVKQLTNEGIKHISKLTSLLSLDISCESLIEDEDLLDISKLVNLRFFNLQGLHNITDVGLQHLLKLKHPNQVNIGLFKNISQQSREDFNANSH